MNRLELKGVKVSSPETSDSGIIQRKKESAISAEATCQEILKGIQSSLQTIKGNDANLELPDSIKNLVQHGPDLTQFTLDKNQIFHDLKQSGLFKFLCTCKEDNADLLLSLASVVCNPDIDIRKPDPLTNIPAMDLKFANNYPEITNYLNALRVLFSREIGLISRQEANFACISLFSKENEGETPDFNQLLKKGITVISDALVVSAEKIKKHQHSIHEHMDPDKVLGFLLMSKCQIRFETKLTKLFEENDIDNELVFDPNDDGLWELKDKKH